MVAKAVEILCAPLLGMTGKMIKHVRMTCIERGVMSRVFFVVMHFHYVCLDYVIRTG